MQKYSLELSSGLFISTNPYLIVHLYNHVLFYKAYQFQSDTVFIEFKSDMAVGNIKSLLFEIFNIKLVQGQYSTEDNILFVGKQL